MPASEKLRPFSIFLSSMSVSTRSMMSPICSMLIVNDTMSAQRRPSALVERLARDLRQVELDRRVQLVHHVVQLAQPLRERAVVGSQHGQHAGEHLLDGVADAQRLAGGQRDRQRRRRNRGRVEIARLRRIVGRRAWPAAAARRCAAMRSVKNTKISASAMLNTRWNSTTSRAGLEREAVDPALRSCRRMARRARSRSA